MHISFKVIIKKTPQTCFQTSCQITGQAVHYMSTLRKGAVTNFVRSSLILFLKSHALLDSGSNSVQFLLPYFLIKLLRSNAYILSFEPHKLVSLRALHWTLPTCTQHHLIYYTVCCQNKGNILLESLLWAQYFTVGKMVSCNAA